MMQRVILMLLLFGMVRTGWAADWPRWRGPGGRGVSAETGLPVRWGPKRNIVWKATIPGEGASSPIVWGKRVFLTSALDGGARRIVHCLDRGTGRLLWSREIADEEPENTSALTGHAAATPVTDGRHVVAFFGNAGVVCYDFSGKQLWRRRFGQFDSELGLASSPVLFKDRVILVCDHDGDRFQSFDSFLIALDVKTGKRIWKTDRPGLFRSWSTPILVPRMKNKQQLIVAAQDQLRAYDPATGKQLWHVLGLTGWVTPSPVFGHGLVYSVSGKNGPTIAARPGDDIKRRIAWKVPTGSPYVCSPVLYYDYLYVHSESGILNCYAAKTGVRVYRERLRGKFSSSSVAADGKIYLTNEEGTTFVISAGPKFELLAENRLGAFALASPAISDGRIFLRTESHLWCLGGKDRQ